MIFCKLGSELDKKFLKKLIDSNDPLIKNEFKLENDMFFSETKETFSFVFKYYEENGKFPSINAIKEVTSLDLLNETAELDLKDYAKAILERFHLQQIDNSIPTIIELSKEAKIEEIRQTLNQMLFNLNDYLKDSDSIVDIRKDAVLRYANYEKRELGEISVMGLPTPWRELDEVTMGIREGDYWMAVARPEVGKSWLSILFADRIWRCDNKVLYISLEMPVYQIINRWDAIHAGISASALDKGKLVTFPDNNNQKRAYLTALNGMSYLPECMIVGNGYVKNLMDVKLLINYYKPDVIVLDAFYNLELGNGLWKDRYNELREVSRQLQSLINKEKLKFFGTTQFQRSGEDLDDIAYTVGISQDTTLVLGMYKDEDDDLNFERTFKMLKARHAEKKIKFRTKFDLFNMDFRFLNFEN